MIMRNIRHASETTKVRCLQMCEAGGSMAPSASFMTGKESRSLKAAYRAIVGKLAPQVAHLEGGMYGWYVPAFPQRTLCSKAGPVFLVCWAYFRMRHPTNRKIVNLPAHHTRATLSGRGVLHAVFF
jgi:hypothetical protein